MTEERFRPDPVEHGKIEIFQLEYDACAGLLQIGAFERFPDGLLPGAMVFTFDLTSDDRPLGATLVREEWCDDDGIGAAATALSQDYLIAREKARSVANQFWIEQERYFDGD